MAAFQTWARLPYPISRERSACLSQHPLKLLIVPGKLLIVPGNLLMVLGKLLIVLGKLLIVPGKFLIVPGKLLFAPGKLLDFPGKFGYGLLTQCHERHACLSRQHRKLLIFRVKFGYGQCHESHVTSCHESQCQILNPYPYRSKTPRHAMIKSLQQCKPKPYSSARLSPIAVQPQTLIAVQP